MYTECNNLKIGVKNERGSEHFLQWYVNDAKLPNIIKTFFIIQYNVYYVNLYSLQNYVN